MRSRTRISLLLLGIMTILALSAMKHAEASSPQGRIADSVKILREMTKQEDVGTMGDLLSHARGVAIFPSVVKAGFVFGGPPVS